MDVFEAALRVLCEKYYKYDMTKLTFLYLKEKLMTIFIDQFHNVVFVYTFLNSLLNRIPLLQ